MSWPVFIPVVLLAIVVVGIVIATAVNEVPATRPWATVAALAIAALPVSIVPHNVLSALSGRSGELINRAPRRARSDRRALAVASLRSRGAAPPYQAFIEATALAVSAATMVIGIVLAVMRRYRVPAATGSSG